MRLKLIYKFLIPVLGTLIVLAIILSVLTTYIVERSLLDQSKTFIAHFVELQTKRHILSSTDFSSPDPKITYQRFNDLSKELQTQEIARIKIWDTNAKVIYSDDQSLIGKTYNNNREVLKALDGTIQSALAADTQEENMFEKQSGNLMEMYVPIFYDGQSKPVGVVETYFKLNALKINTATANQQIIFSILIVSILMALILTVLIQDLVTDPIRKFSKAISLIKKGNYSERLNITSNDEFGELSQTFNQMAGGLKRLQELKNEFVYLAIHELKSPVTVIDAFSSLILQNRQSLSEEIINYASKIKRSSDQLNILVSDILYVAKSDTGTLKIIITPCDQNAIINDCIDELNQLAIKKRITITYKAKKTPKVNADNQRLKEVILNLLTNAIKYSPEGGRIVINHTITSNTVITNISDNGLGIAVEEQKKIFKKFYRTRNVSENHIPGTGLGLFITKELIKRMHGKIWFKSALNQGSVFSFSLLRVKASKK